MPTAATIQNVRDALVRFVTQLLSNIDSFAPTRSQLPAPSRIAVASSVGAFGNNAFGKRLHTIYGIESFLVVSADVRRA